MTNTKLSSRRRSIFSRTSARSILLAAIVVAAPAGLALSGCGDDTSDAATTSNGPSGPTTGPGTGGGTSSSSSANGGNGGNGGNATGGNGGNGGSGLGGAVNCDPPTTDPIPNLVATEVATGFSAPVLVKAAGADTTRLYVVQQGGVIRLILNGTLEDQPFLDISDLLQAGGERGLLGLAFHPDYEQNGRFFVHYSSNGDGGLNTGDTVIAEFARSADPNVASPDQVAEILTETQPDSNHNGGSIEFGGDGMLYIFLGDGGSGGDPWGTIGNGQEPDTFLGKVLRIDVAALPYSIPAGNMAPPFRPEIWDYGLRNPYRVSFDACTADLYIADVGQGQWEEVNVEPAGQGQTNYGWRCREGAHDFNLDCGPNAGSAVDPAIEYDHGDGVSITGGYVYRGSAIPSLRGTYFYGDFGSGIVRSFVWAEGAISQETNWDSLDMGGNSISSFGQDAAGEMYIVHWSQGTVYRIEAE
jgi:glucose/arabinose dehydrogenase